MEEVIIDTDILSFILRKHPAVLPKARAYLAEHGQFTFTIITRYEILRGLKAKNAVQQIANWRAFVQCQYSPSTY